MKKLMLAVAIVCATVATQAATANWSFAAANTYNGTGSTATTDKISGTAFLFDAGVTSQAILYAMILAGETISASTDGYVATASVANGTVATTKFSYGEQSASASEKSYYDYYFVIVGDDKAYFSNEKHVAANATDTAASVAFGSQNASASGTFSSLAPASEGFQGAGHWSQAVPEPTSGLLLLLGMAGLALKRKQA